MGIPDAYLKRILQDVLVEFMTLYPNATVNVVVDDFPTLARRSAEGSVDLAFVTEGSWPTRGSVVFRDRLLVIGPATGNLHQADPLPLAVWDERNFDEGLMIAALEAMNRHYRVAYICRSVSCPARGHYRWPVRRGAGRKQHGGGRARLSAGGRVSGPARAHCPARTLAREKIASDRPVGAPLCAAFFPENGRSFF